jgi:addiction module HigA family antidote
MARKPIHPGERLADEIDSLCMSARQLAETLAIPSNQLYQIIAGKRNISADTALRLGRYFKMSSDFWMNFQSAYELDLARQVSGKSILKLPQRVA